MPCIHIHYGFLKLRFFYERSGRNKPLRKNYNNANLFNLVTIVT